jgi:hypothetical protein
MLTRFTCALAGLLMVLAASLVVAPTSSADPGGSGHVYRCSGVRITGEGPIAFSDIYKCSSGPMDVSTISELSTYTDKQTGWIDGECAWHAYHRLGWRSMTRIWNWCLTRPTYVP